MAENVKEGLKNIGQNQVQYIFNNPICGDDTETHTVREWLESFGIPVPDGFFLEWQQTVLELGNIFRIIEKGMSSNIMEQVWTAAFVGIYLSYDLDQEFLPQFEENAQKFFAMLQEAFMSDGNKS